MGFDNVNRGKRSVAVNLKDDAGRETLYRLVETADVLVANVSPGVTERLRCDSDTVTEYNEELVYCSLSGYGRPGPLADQPGHDLNFAGFAGLFDLTRVDRDRPPAIPGYEVAGVPGAAAFVARDSSIDALYLLIKIIRIVYVG